MKKLFATLMCVSFLTIIFHSFGTLVAQQNATACPGTLASRLVAGEQGRVAPGNANNIRSTASTDGQLLGEIPAGGTFLILEGPTCAGGYAWWRVDYNGTVGWTVEGSDTEYWLEPAGPLPTQAATLTPSTTQPETPQQVACPGFLPSRLLVGEQGRVVPGPANNLRSEPASGTQQLAEIPGGATFLVLEGPLCAQGLAWWRVDYRGQIGWTAEGSDDVYWLEPAGPVPTQAPTLTPTITFTPRPTLTPSPTYTPAPALPPVTSFSGRDDLLFAPLPENRQPLTADNIDQIRPLSLLGGGGVANFTWSPDGSMMAVLNSLGVWLVDTNSPDSPGVLLENPNLTISAMAFSPDGQVLALGSTGYESNADQTLQLWAVETGERLPAFRQYVDSVTVVAFSPDGSLLATGGMRGSARLWDAETGELVRNISTDRTYGWVSDIAFGPDGSQVAFSDNSTYVRIWNIAQDEHQIEYEIEGGILGDLTFSADGALLFAAGDGGETATPGVLRIWDMTTAQRVTSPQFLRRLRGITASPDGRQLVLLAQSPGDVLYIWDTQAREVERTLEMPRFAQTVAFSPDGESLAVAHSDGTIRLWDIESGDNEVLLDYGESRLYDRTAISADGNLIAVSSQTDALVRLYDGTSRQEIAVFDDFVGNVVSLNFEPDGTSLAVIVNNRSGTHQYGWNWETDQATETIVTSVPTPQDYTQLARSLLTSRQSSVYSVVILPNCSLLALTDGISLQFWDMNTRQPLAIIRFFGNVVGFSADGTTMLTSTNGAIWLWGIPA